MAAALHLTLRAPTAMETVAVLLHYVLLVSVPRTLLVVHVQQLYQTNVLTVTVSQVLARLNQFAELVMSLVPTVYVALHLLIVLLRSNALQVRSLALML